MAPCPNRGAANAEVMINTRELTGGRSQNDKRSAAKKRSWEGRGRSK
jgi:hypothetical protein